MSDQCSGSDTRPARASSACCTAQWHLLNGAGAPAPSCGGYTTAARLDCGPLPADTYQVQVLSYSGTGTADVHLQRLTSASACDSPALPCDVPQSTNVTPAVDSDLFHFTEVAREIVQVSVGETSGSFTTAATLTCVSLNVNQTYHVEVASYSGAGSYTVEGESRIENPPRGLGISGKRSLTRGGYRIRRAARPPGNRSERVPRSTSGA